MVADYRYLHVLSVRSDQAKLLRCLSSMDTRAIAQRFTQCPISEHGGTYHPFRGTRSGVENCHGAVPEMSPYGLKVGKDLEVAKGPVVFEGKRLVVVADVTDHLDILRDVEKQGLKRQGFQLPSQEAETSETIELEFEAPHGCLPPRAEPFFKSELCETAGFHYKQSGRASRSHSMTDSDCAHLHLATGGWRGHSLPVKRGALPRYVPDVHGTARKVVPASRWK